MLRRDRHEREQQVQNMKGNGTKVFEHESAKKGSKYERGHVRLNMKEENKRF